MLKGIEELAEEIGVGAACQAIGVPRSSYYRWRERGEAGQAEDRGERPASVRSLSQAEREKVRQALNSERFQDKAPREVYATLLDEGEYLCSWRTMYRILEEHEEVRERRNQLRHPQYARPELLATGPNQVWSWDITKLLGPVTWSYYYLYVILDVFSRYVVGWMLADCESADLAADLIAQTCAKQGILQAQLTLHADRGSAMTSKTVAQLLSDLGVVKSHSRPHTSNDNPYSEAQFKTMKYQPDYPKRFASQDAAHTWARTFFHWYNYEHHHTGIALLTPAAVHFGAADTILQQRQKTLSVAYALHPERFVKGVPAPQLPPLAVWINPPKKESDPIS